MRNQCAQVEKALEQERAATADALSKVSLEKFAREEAEKARDANAARAKAQKAELQLRDEKLREVRAAALSELLLQRCSGVQGLFILLQ